MDDTRGLAEYYDDLSRFVLWRRALTMHKTFAAAPSLTQWLGRRMSAFTIDKLLDVGCGFGVPLAELRPVGEAHGLTISAFQKDAAERIHRGTPNLKFFTGSYEDPLPDIYDAMLCIESLVFASDLHSAVSNLARHLTPGGRLFVVEDVRVGRKESRFEAPYLEGFRLERIYRDSEFESAFECAGLALEQKIDLTPWVSMGRSRSLPLKTLALGGLRRIAPTKRWANVISAYWGGSFLERLYAEGSFSYHYYQLRASAT
jgi:SAM-dependent methyltransferase